MPQDINPSEARSLIHALVRAAWDHCRAFDGIGRWKGAEKRERIAAKKLFRALTGRNPTREETKALTD